MSGEFVITRVVDTPREGGWGGTFEQLVAYLAQAR